MGLNDSFEDYIEVLRSFASATEAPFVSDTGNRMCFRTSLRVFYSWTDQIMGSRMGVHEIRRSTITAWYRQGHDPPQHSH